MNVKKPLNVTEFLSRLFIVFFLVVSATIIQVFTIMFINLLIFITWHVFTISGFLMAAGVFVITSFTMIPLVIFLYLIPRINTAIRTISKVDRWTLFFNKISTLLALAVSLLLGFITIDHKVIDILNPEFKNIFFIISIMTTYFLFKYLKNK